MSTAISILIPTYNEAENIEIMLRSVFEHIPRHMPVHILVVDDDESILKLMKMLLEDFGYFVRTAETGERQGCDRFYRFYTVS